MTLNFGSFHLSRKCNFSKNGTRAKSPEHYRHLVGMPGKTQDVFVRKKYVSTYNVSIFPQVVTPLYDTFLSARPPCSKKVASKLCTLSYKTRALLVLLSFRCVHVSRIIFPPMCTHRGPYVTSLSRQEGRQK